MSHYSQPGAVPYVGQAAPSHYPGQPQPGVEIPPPPPLPPHPHSMQPACHPYSSNHAYSANNAAYPPLPLGHHHQYPPGYAAPPPPAYACPPSAPPALYADGRLAYAAPAVPPPPMSPYPPNPAPVVVYANGQPSPAPSLVSPQQGYYSSMLNSPLPSPHSITSPTRPYSLPNQTSPLRSSSIPAEQTNGLKSPLSISISRSPVASIKSPGAFHSSKSPSHRSPGHQNPASPKSAEVKSPVKTPESKTSTASQANGPLRSLEKMLLHEKSEKAGQDKDRIECKANLLVESDPARADSWRRRSSSHSGDDKQTRTSPEPVPEPPVPVEVKKKRGRPTGSRGKKRLADNDDTPVKRKRIKKIDAKIALSMKTKPDKTDDKLGPRIRIEGTRSNPKSCTVINNLSHSDDKDKKKGADKERVSFKPDTESVKLTDAPWVCCFCGWGSTHVNLGDLFGPYHIDGFRPPRRDVVKKRRRRDSRCSEDGERSRRASEERPAGEVWVHEECATWAEGVYMVGYRIQGLDEAARIAKQTQCSVCKVDGATIGCLHKGCQQKYHYLCAINKDCLLNEENFSLVCHKHKDKKIKMIT